MALPIWNNIQQHLYSSYTRLFYFARYYSKSNCVANMRCPYIRKVQLYGDHPIKRDMLLIKFHAKRDPSNSC